MRWHDERLGVQSVVVGRHISKATLNPPPKNEKGSGQVDDCFRHDAEHESCLCEVGELYGALYGGIMETDNQSSVRNSTLVNFYLQSTPASEITTPVFSLINQHSSMKSAQPSPSTLDLGIGAKTPCSSFSTAGPSHGSRAVTNITSLLLDNTTSVSNQQTIPSVYINTHNLNKYWANSSSTSFNNMYAPAGLHNQLWGDHTP